MDELNVLITGPPRSGTTLTCELLMSLPDTVALDEPMDRAYLTTKPVEGGHGLLARLRATSARRAPKPTNTRNDAPVSPETVSLRVGQFISDTRRSALSRGVVHTKSVNGRVTGRKISDERDASGLRRRLVSVGEVDVGKPLSDDFMLAIKQCGGFTAVLEALVARFSVFTLVRNPLSVLLSWQSVPMPVRDGHVPLAERLDNGLARELAKIEDATDRQFYLLTWFFGKYSRLLPPEQIVRYEDVVATGGKALQGITSRASQLDGSLVDGNRDTARGDDPAMVKALGTRLLEVDGPWWDFYRPDDVTKVVDRLT